jgi:large subunit ribosomal protein L10
VSQVSQEKLEIVEETKDLLEKYEVIAAADLYKVGSEMLQNMRRQLRKDMAVKCVKNTLMSLSLKEAEKEGAEKFMDAIPGQNLFLFTNGNPFKLAMRLENSKVRVFARPGDIAIDEIVIPSGNTGLSPGPIIGKFGALGIRTRIEAGNIWVNQDTVVAREGDEISEDLADLIQRLGIRAAEMGLSIKAVYEDGTIIPGEELLLDINSYIDQLSQAFDGAFQVAVNAFYPTPSTITTLISLTYQDTRKVAIEAGYLTEDTVKDLIAKAHAQARTLATQVGKAQAK